MGSLQLALQFLVLAFEPPLHLLLLTLDGTLQLLLLPFVVSLRLLVLALHRLVLARASPSLFRQGPLVRRVRVLQGLAELLQLPLGLLELVLRALDARHGAFDDGRGLFGHGLGREGVGGEQGSAEAHDEWTEGHVGLRKGTVVGGDAPPDRAAPSWTALRYSRTGLFPGTPAPTSRTMARVPRFLHTLRLVALVEAVSYLLLLGIAMPLKYVWHEPMAVRVLGMAHGVLFLWLLWLLIRARFEAGWPHGRVLLVFAASLIPLWPFFLDRRVRGWLAEPVA